ncbi:peptidoglycan DD-metalloendopeptidase family protein [Planococcus soli]|uniref:peptidoglycan DD-metalloendopeptidase family protein n=1 Tax=Planococcus soli TaxID=2666072 RepID=UPI00115F38C8|nr:peptidoglycan DD-metalloendopeptidase family protein [Planococcus soli]
MEQIQGLSIGLNLDTAGIQQGLKTLKGNLKGIDAEMKNNMSAFSKSEKSAEKYETRLGGMNKKLDATKEAVNAAKREHERMIEIHGEGSDKANKAGAAYNNLSADFNNLQRHIGEVSEEFENFQREQEIAESSLGRFGNTMNTAGGKFSKFGEGMKGVGSGLTVGLTAPIVGLGLAAVATANEFDDAQGLIQSGLGITAEKAEELEGVAKNLWANGFSGSVNDAAEAVVTVSKNLAALPTEEIEKITGYAGILADRFEIDVAQSTNTAGMVMEAFGGTATEAFDLMTHGLQNAKGDGGELLDVFNEYSPQFAALGYDAEGFMATLIEGSQSGAFNFDLLGDAAKESFLLMGEGSEDVQDALKGLGLNSDQIISGINGGGEEAQKSFMAVSAAIAGIEDPTKKTAASIALFGTPIEDLGPQFQGFFSGVEQNLEGVEGATQRAGDALYDNLGAKATTVFRGFQEDLLPVGEILVDVAEEWLPKVAASLGNITGKFTELSPETQKNIVMFGGIAAAAGPLIAGLGFVASAIGGVMTVVGPLSTAIVGAGGLAASFGTVGTAIAAFATGPIGLGIAAIAGIGIATGALVKHFREDAIPEVDRFGEGVSESTQKALGSFFELSDGASLSLMNMKINGLEVTEVMADELLTKYENMNDQILNSMEERHKAENEQLKTFFASSSTLTEEEEAKAFQLKVNRQEAAMTVQQSHEDEIQRIVETAATQKRELTESELLQIDTLHQQMNQSAVVYLSENEMEQKVIMERMAATSGELSAQQAATVTRNSADARDKVKADAETKYNETVAMAIRERDETGTITAEQATKIIAEATKTKDTAIGHAEDMHEGVVTEAKLQAGEHVDEVDWQTGEILSKWDIYKEGVVTRFKETNKNSMDDFKQWGTDFNENWNLFNEGAKEKVATYKSNVKNRFKETNADNLADFKSWGTNFNDAWNNFNNGAKEKVDAYKTAVKKRFRETNEESLADFKRWGGNIKSWAGDAKDGIMRTFDSLVTGAKNLPGRIGSGISSMASKVSDGVKAVSNKLSSGLGAGVNGVISGINWVLGKIGVDKKSHIDSWEVKKYAHGTKAHPGGLALLGDGRGSNAGRELIKTPSGDLGLSPDTDTLMNLPKGSQVLSATKTRELLGDIPKYNMGNSSISDFFGGLYKGAKDFGSKAISGGKKTLGKVKDAAFNVWDHVSNPGKLLSTALSILGISSPIGGSFVGDMAKGGYDKVKSNALGYLKGKIDNSGTQAGSGHGFGSAFRLTSRRGFRINPVTGIGQMHQGDDWAARLGTLIPAQAAGKVIQAGFHGIRGNFVRVQSGIMDRLYQHNQRNMVKVGQNVRKGQAVGTVGSTGRSTGAHLHYEVRRNGVNINPNGLETGGLVNSEQLVRVGEKGRQEMVIPMHPSRRTDAMKLLAIAGKKLMPGNDKGITRPNQLPNVGGGGNAIHAAILKSNEYLMKQGEMLMKQNELLMQLLRKDTGFYVDGKELSNALDDPMNETLGASSARNMYLNGIR